MNKKIFQIAFIISCFSFSFFNLYAQPKDQLSQIATIDALLAGAYDGILPIEELHSYGNFGLGTFDKLNGEMIVYNGNVYQIKYDGTVVKNEVPVSTPFAAIVNFDVDNSFTIKSISEFKKLVDELNNNISNKNLPVAIKVTGSFDYVKVRSVPKQNKPYLPLAEVTKDQSVFEYNNVEGTLIGFVIPEYFKGLNVPGLHVHFLSKDETKGGHLLDLKLDEGNTEIDYMNKFYLYLPEDSEHFKNLDLQKDRSEELENVER